MSWYDVFRGGVVLGQSAGGDPGSVALDELLQTHELISAESDFLVVSPRRMDDTLTQQQAIAELGSASPSPFGSYMREEHIGELRDVRGLQKYLEMKRASSAVRSSLRLFKTPIVGAHWFIEPGSAKKRDQKAAEWLTDMFDNGMTHTWEETLNEILLMCDYGCSIFEKVFQERNGKLEWKKLAPRHPLDIQSWVWDKNGGPAGIRMWSDKDADGTFIPIEKLIVFTMDIEGGDVRGTSLLRSAYQNWYYMTQLYKIDAIQKERHGIGVPVIRLPVGYNAGDKAAAENLGRNLRMNERAHVVLPPGWDLLFAKLEGQPVDAMKSIDQHELQIWNNVLAPFVSKGDMKDADQSLFMKSTRYVANGIAAAITKHGLKQLIDLNFVRQPSYPALRARRIGEWEDLRTLSFAVRNLVGAGVWIPDEPMDAHMRREFDMPLADPETARIAAAPQQPMGQPNLNTNANPQPGVPVPPGPPTPPGPPRVGPPRQKTSPPSGLPRGNAGNDRSGG